MTPLRGATLSAHASGVVVPTYDRNALTPSVVHIGVGSFHRSHQAVYFDDLAQLGDPGWGIVGVGLHRRAMANVLRAQDGLYSVMTRGANHDEARVIGVLGRYLFAPESGAGVLTALADPRTRLVTLTITGNGYRADPDEDDLPSTALGFLVAGLSLRRAAGIPPFSVMSCDNLPDNGRLAREAVVEHARHRHPALGDWIEANTAFPSSMVDRITPRTTPADRDFLERRFGVRDRWPVVTEPYRQWVVEDRFSHGRPPLDAVGVHFVSDVRPYALTKTRLLNAGHCALGHLGYLAGHRTSAEAMDDPVIDLYMRRLMADEIGPLLPRVPGIDLAAYRETVRERLANPKISDQLTRLARNGSGKFPAHVLSSILEARRAGRPHPLLTLAVAGWCRYVRGVDEQGDPIPLDDPLADRLRRLARAGGPDPRRLLAERQVFGTLGDDEAFAAELTAAMADLARFGVRGAIRARVAGAAAVAA